MVTRYRPGDEYTCRLERLLFEWSEYDQRLYYAAKEVMGGGSTAEQAATEYDLDPAEVEELADELVAYEAALTAMTLREGFRNE